MIRRISTKWVLAVLGAVVVPLVLFALFVHTRVRDRLSGEVVRYHLLSVVAELTDRIDTVVEERRLDLAHLSTNPTVGWQLDLQMQSSGVTQVDAPEDPFRGNVQASFDRFVAQAQIYDLILSIDATGRLVAHNQFQADGRRLKSSIADALRARDFSSESWFVDAMSDGNSQIDHHRSDMLDPGLTRDAQNSPRHIGFVDRIELEEGEAVGVVLSLMNWSHVQEEVANYGVRRLQLDSPDDGERVGEDIYQSSYAWIWMSDADTIIAHPREELLGERVSGAKVGLPAMVETALAADWGLYPDYSFSGDTKKAAFKHCAGVDNNGFGWVVGVGINDEDIYGPVAGFLRLLWAVSCMVLAVAVVWTIVLSHRLTRPILELQQHTRRIAAGDLDARIEVKTRDEIGELAESFNSMTAELKENREQLVRAEKESAWREMARQVAHEIKNPLTPISLSVGLLKRSHEEKSPEFDRILARTIELVLRQVDNMRDIATDFHAFAGEQRVHEDIDAGGLLDEVFELNQAWARDLGVHLSREGGGGVVLGDSAEMHRALLNLVSNALEAMPDGGDLLGRVQVGEHLVTIELQDSGVGLSKDVETKLFEPYFTTRSSGTGLGLAIVRRVIEDMGGSVELENSPEPEVGAIARIVLPRSS
ncbi:MAG: signal transduction histidine kinase [Planctomycetota bacterium]|jgi:signal transduction histidine kinase